jgi:hypothetical protein
MLCREEVTHGSRAVLSSGLVRDAVSHREPVDKCNYRSRKGEHNVQKSECWETMRSYQLWAGVAKALESPVKYT